MATLPLVPGNPHPKQPLQGPAPRKVQQSLTHFHRALAAMWVWRQQCWLPGATWAAWGQHDVGYMEKWICNAEPSCWPSHPGRPSEYRLPLRPSSDPKDRELKAAPIGPVTNAHDYNAIFPPWPSQHHTSQALVGSRHSSLKWGHRSVLLVRTDLYPIRPGLGHSTHLRRQWGRQQAHRPESAVSTQPGTAPGPTAASHLASAD